MSNTPRSNTRRDRSAWAQLMAQYEASDLPQHLFCEQRGLAYSTFSYWRKQLRQSANHENQPASLIELPLLSTNESQGWRVELDLGQGMVLRLKCNRPNQAVIPILISRHRLFSQSQSKQRRKIMSDATQAHSHQGTPAKNIRRSQTAYSGPR